MNIFKIRNETMIATTPHQGGPADRLLIILVYSNAKNDPNST